jgi:hypothetical protein
MIYITYKKYTCLILSDQYGVVLIWQFQTVLLRQPSEDVVRSSDFIEDVKVETAEVSNKFKFFETYKAPEKERKQFRITPPREGQVKV